MGLIAMSLQQTGFALQFLVCQKNEIRQIFNVKIRLVIKRLITWIPIILTPIKVNISNC